MTAQSTDSFVRVAETATAREESPMPVQAGDRSIGLFHHEGGFYATDLRCPHMGFPLTDGTVEDGILTCPWHHARFELSCGDTFDPFADDVATYPVEVRDDGVYVDPTPEDDRDPKAHWTARLEHGLREDISLIVAKAVIGLDEAGVDPAVAIRTGAAFGTSYRAMGWGRGLTTLGVMANLLPEVRPEDRPRALYAGLTEVADDVAGAPPYFPQDPLKATDVEPDRLNRWFREAIEVRDADGAERVVRAAIRADLPESAIAGMFVGAATDHLYLDTGHRLDFVNKAFETLDRVGWEHADQLLPSLVPGLASADRAEENASWRQPIDVAALCFEAHEELSDRLAAGRDRTWQEPDALIDELLGDDPEAIVGALSTAIGEGAAATELAGLVAEAAARRVAQFGTSNEFRDWNTVHHTYTYANAVHGLAGRTDAPERYRGVFDAAINVYLDRFLNTPPAPLPSPSGDADPDAAIEELMGTFEIESDEAVDRAGELTAAYLAGGGDVARLKRALGTALLREDVGFHTRQNVEAAFAQYDATLERLADGGGEATGDEARERASVHLIGTARYLSAHTPTRRSGEQTYDIARRLHRGDRIHEA